MNDDEYVEESGPAAFWGGLIILALLCGCHKIPQKMAHQDKAYQPQIQHLSNMVATHTR